MSDFCEDLRGLGNEFPRDPRQGSKCGWLAVKFVAPTVEQRAQTKEARCANDNMLLNRDMTHIAFKLWRTQDLYQIFLLFFIWHLFAFSSHITPRWIRMKDPPLRRKSMLLSDEDHCSDRHNVLQAFSSLPSNFQTTWLPLTSFQFLSWRPAWHLVMHFPCLLSVLSSLDASWTHRDVPSFLDLQRPWL